MSLRLVAVMGLVLLASCASAPKGSDEAGLAASLAGQDRYKDAIAAMDQAIAKEPRNEDYKALRSRYIAAYSASVNSQVNRSLSGTPGKAALDSAEDLIDDARDAGVPQSELSSAAGRVQSTRDSLYADLQRDYNAAVAAMDASDWVRAHELLSGVEKLYPNYEDSRQRLSRARQGASRDYMGAAGRALKDDDLPAARAAVNKMLAVDPQNGIARNMLGKIDERDSKIYFLDKVSEAQAANDDASLEKYCRIVMQYDAQDEQCLGILAELDKDIANNLVQKATAATSQGRFFDAADKYNELHQFENAGFGAERQALKSSLARKLNRAAEEAVDERQYGLAWALYEKLEEVDPAYPGLGDAQRSVADNIRTRTRKSIAVFDFNSPSDSVDAGVIVANNLIARLFNNAGRDIKILERENLKSILEEMKLGQIGVVSEDTAKEMGRIHGIDYAIMGSVLLYKVDTRESESSKTVRYKIGEEIEDNIDYLNWKAVNPNPTKSELASAPPAKIKVPKMAVTEYDVVEIKKVGFISLSFRIVDVATGENTRVHTIERKKEVKDSGSEGLADAGIAYDPAEIPTDTELLQMLTDEIVDTMSVDVLRPLQSLEKTYFEKGESYEKRNEMLRAVEAYVDGIFNEQMKSVSASPLTDESLKRIDRIMHEHSFET